MTETPSRSSITRRFERLLGLTSDQTCCRDYMSMEEQRRLAARDPTPVSAENSGAIIGEFVYDFEKKTETYTSVNSEKYKK